jgi:trans-2,3-dihydro-3-hydroxyanthranilate isomerase
MGAYEFITVDVFTETRFGGNPLAVFPHAAGLGDDEMQAIAREFNLSETTFVFPPTDPRHTARVRIFTPGSEVPFAGHPNVGTGFVLAQSYSNLPEHFVFEEQAGLVRVHLLKGAGGQVNGARVAAPRALSIGIAVAPAMVAACAGLDERHILSTSHSPLVASVGTEFVIAELIDLDALGRATPDLGAFRRSVAALPELGGRLGLLLYVTVDGMARQLRARMFAPLVGVIEDPATGSANAALAALLTSLAPGEDVELTYEIEQGAELGRPSQLLASARKTGEGPVFATVAGSCVMMMRGVYEST